MTWISVDDRLPENYRDVLVVAYFGIWERPLVTIGGYYRERELELGEYVPWDGCYVNEETDEYFAPPGWYEGTRICVDSEYCGMLRGVTHWMPLPELPKDKK